MARVTGPFLSISASGTVGKMLTAGTWKGIAYMREWFKPANPRTAAQVAQRTHFADAVASWHTQTADTKLAWKAHVEGQALTGFNAYVKYVVDILVSGGTIPIDPVLPPA